MTHSDEFEYPPEKSNLDSEPTIQEIQSELFRKYGPVKGAHILMNINKNPEFTDLANQTEEKLRREKTLFWNFRGENEG